MTTSTKGNSKIKTHNITFTSDEKRTDILRAMALEIVNDAYDSANRESTKESENIELLNSVFFTNGKGQPARFFLPMEEINILITIGEPSSRQLKAHNPLIVSSYIADSILVGNKESNHIVISSQLIIDTIKDNPITQKILKKTLARLILELLFNKSKLQDEKETNEKGSYRNIYTNTYKAFVDKLGYTTTESDKHGFANIEIPNEKDEKLARHDMQEIYNITKEELPIVHKTNEKVGSDTKEISYSCSIEIDENEKPIKCSIFRTQMPLDKFIDCIGTDTCIKCGQLFRTLEAVKLDFKKASKKKEEVILIK